MAGKPFEGLGTGRLARGLAAAYGIGQKAHAAVRVARSTGVDVPVISVGNLLVGGTGKTPLAAAIAAEFAAKNRPVAVISRGYGGTERGPVKVPPGGAPSEFGDEPVELANALRKSAVWVARDRVAGAEAAVENGAQVLLLDDGFGYRTLARDVDLLVFDERGLGNGMLLPAGPLREPPESIERADALLLRGETKLAETFGKPVFRFRVALRGFRYLDGSEAERPGRAFATAGIGWPERFFTSLRDAGVDVVKEEGRPDHARWKPADVLLIEKAAAGLPIVVTAKDAVKLRPLSPGGTWIVAEAAAEVDGAFWPWLAEHAKLL